MESPMKIAPLFFALLLSVSMAACQADDSKTHNATSDTKAANPLGQLEKKDMANADARQVLLYAGWKPTPDKQCQANVVGADYADLCKKVPHLCQACNNMPELSSCSADGACLMRFHKGDQSVAISTYGPRDDWNVHGSDSQLNVTDVKAETTQH